jgi:hypothetical protein
MYTTHSFQNKSRKIQNLLLNAGVNDRKWWTHVDIIESLQMRCKNHFVKTIAKVLQEILWGLQNHCKNHCKLIHLL